LWLCDVISEFSRTEETIQSAVRYPSELTDEEGEILEPIINELESYTIGRPRKSDPRELLNAIFYLNKTGCPWRDLPKDFPSYKLVNYYYNKWTDNRLPEKVNTVLRQRLRQKKALLRLVWVTPFFPPRRVARSKPTLCPSFRL